MTLTEARQEINSKFRENQHLSDEAEIEKVRSTNMTWSRQLQLLNGSSTTTCRTRFDSSSLAAAKIVTKMIAIIGILYRNYARFTLHRSCLPIYGIAIILFLDGFEGNANISVAIKSGSTCAVEQNHFVN